MPLTWLIDYTPADAALRAFAKASVPPWFHMSRAGEELDAFLVQFWPLVTLEEDWDRHSFLKYARRKWLDLLAREQGSERQANETDAMLLERLYRVEDAVTKPSILAAVKRIMTAAGAAGDPVMVEVRRDRGYFNRSAFFSRGYRMGSMRPSAIIVILPPGTSEAVRASAYEAVRTRKAGGFFHDVEVDADGIDS